MKKGLRVLWLFFSFYSGCILGQSPKTDLTFEVNEVCDLLGGSLTATNKLLVSKGYTLASRDVEFNTPILKYKRPGSSFKINVSLKKERVQSIFWRENYDDVGSFIQVAVEHYKFVVQPGGGGVSAMINSERKIGLLVNLRQPDEGLVVMGATKMD